MIREGTIVMRRFVLGLALLGLAACRNAVTGPAIAMLELHVDREKVPCVTLIETECLRVRERESDSWQLFYNEIEGFTWEPGYEYRLRVVRLVVSNPPADGSAFRYVLMQVLSRTASPGSLAR